MFWGITLESGKKYTQVLQKSFCLTMAALGFENPSNDNVYVVAEVNKAQHVLCSLQSGKIPQQILNLNFTEGELVSFFIEGQGVVHLTGFLTLDDNDSDTDSSDEDEKSEPKRDVMLQSKEAHNVPSTYIHKNGVNNEKVSDVSWQGILSGSQESNDDDVVTNGVSKIHNINRESKESGHESDEKATQEVKETSGIALNNGISETDYDKSSDCKNIHENGLPNDEDGLANNENGLSNNEDVDAREETSDDSSDDEDSSLCSEESDTRYILADNNNDNKNKKNVNDKKATAPRKKQTEPVNDESSGPRKKKTKIEREKKTRGDDSDNNNKTSKLKPRIKRTYSKEKGTPSTKRAYSRANSTKDTETLDEHPPSKQLSKQTMKKVTPNKDVSNKPSPKQHLSSGSTPPRRSEVKRMMHIRSERLRTMRKRKVDDKPNK